MDNNDKPKAGPSSSTGKMRRDAPFDFTKYPRRLTLFKVAYHGQNHDGLAKQDHTKNTVEEIFCAAVARVRLVPDAGPEKFSRCGRTDKGVSALGNAFSLVVRASADACKPLDYCSMINNGLPPTVRVVGWSFVPDTFDARFSCLHRTYRYYFLTGSLNVLRMQEAADHLIGSHNFRNFCKLDVVNVDNFVREVQHAVVAQSEFAPQLVSFCEIRGNAFLYHQIRCIMAVLFLVGRGLEEPSVVKALLERGDAKPLYSMADDSPLVLWDCHYDPAVVQWNISDTARRHVLVELQDIFTALIVRGVAAADMRTQLTRWLGDDGSTAPEAEDDGVLESSYAATGCDWTSDRLQGGIKRRQHELFAAKNSRGSRGGYTKLLERPLEATYAESAGRLSGSKRMRLEANQAKKVSSANGEA